MPVDEEVFENLSSADGVENTAPVAIEEEEELPQFDQAYAKDFDGLNYLGALTHEFEWLGHKFVIRTLTVDEYLAVAAITKDYLEGVSGAQAYATAIVSLCIETLDGQYLPIPVQEETKGYAWAYQRFNFVKSRWYPYTINRVFDEFNKLETRAEKVFESMGNASGWTESQTLGLNANSV